MRAAQVMTPDVLSISSDATVFDAAELLVGTGVSAMPVVDGTGRMVGIVSEADLLRRPEIGTEPRKSWLQRVFADDVAAAAEYVTLHSRRVRDVMSKPVITVQEDDTLRHVADVMEKRQVKRVPVMRGDFVVGIVSRANLLQALLSRDPTGAGPHPSDEQIRREIEAAVRKQAWTSPWPTNILVNAGVVHLWGFVPSAAASDAYRVAAENVAGVKKVKNHLRRMPASVGMGI
ncbi:MAG: CBS domain-containing protein [Proteobacteria bacterium]|nr:CBS domain-containing protein [Pseudomonadota bacterium]